MIVDEVKKMCLLLQIETPRIIRKRMGAVRGGGEQASNGIHEHHADRSISN